MTCLLVPLSIHLKRNPLDDAVFVFLCTPLTLLGSESDPLRVARSRTPNREQLILLGSSPPFLDALLAARRAVWMPLDLPRDQGCASAVQMGKY
jgi:hypothetical protein